MNKPYIQSAFETRPDEPTAATVERHFRYFGARLPDGWWAAGFGFAMGASLLTASAVGRRGVLFFLGFSGLLALLFPHALVRANARNALLWIFPAWALFSVAWSIDPDRTLHSATLLLLTMAIGLTLGAMPHRRAVGAGLGGALVAYIAYSLAYGTSTAFSDVGSGGEALTGITTGKNFFGHIAAMTFLMTPIFLAFARGRWVVPVRAFTLFALAISGFALFQSHATGSMLAAALGLMVMLAVLLVRHVPWQFRVVVIAAVLGVMILYLIFGQQLQDEVFNAVLRTFRKDSSLTGRTVLWEHADRLIEQHRMLGYGYSAFWYYSNPDALLLWRMMGVPPTIGFNFHNTPRDILIGVGWIGLLLYIASFGYALVRTAVRALGRGDLPSAVGLGVLTYFLVRMPVESAGVTELTIDSLLLLTFLSITLKPEQPAEPDGTPVRVPRPEWRRAEEAPMRTAAFPED